MSKNLEEEIIDSETISCIRKLSQILGVDTVSFLQKIIWDSIKKVAKITFLQDVSNTLQEYGINNSCRGEKIDVLRFEKHPVYGVPAGLYLLFGDRQFAVVLFVKTTSHSTRKILEADFYKKCNFAQQSGLLPDMQRKTNFVIELREGVEKCISAGLNPRFFADIARDLMKILT